MPSFLHEVSSEHAGCWEPGDAPALDTLLQAASTELGLQIGSPVLVGLSCSGVQGHVAPLPTASLLHYAHGTGIILSFLNFPFPSINKLAQDLSSFNIS